MDEGRQSRSKKDNSSRLSALERLKKARQGEKVKYELTKDDDLYEEVEVGEDEYEEDGFIEKDYDDEDIDNIKKSTKKPDTKKKPKNESSSYHLDTNSVKTKTASNNNKNMKKDKSTADNNDSTTATPTSAASTTKDIRSVFANAKAKKPENNQNEAKSNDTKFSEDDLMNEIMQELSSSTVTNKPKKQQTSTMQQRIIPSSPSIKRKMSPLKSRPEKRIELDDNLIELLTNDIDSDEGTSCCTSKVIEVKDEKTTPVKVKDEPSTQHSDIITNDDMKLFDEIELKNIKIKNEQYFNELNGDGDDDTVQEIKQEKVQQVDDNELNSIKSKLDSINVYWLDAHEDAYGSNPGCVYLFGRMQIPDKPDTYLSVCCIVKNIPRIIYVLPRKHKYNRKTKETDTSQEVTMDDVKDEMGRLLDKYKILSYRSRSIEKLYAFDSQHDVPYKCEYLQIEYPPEMPQLPHDIDGETFQCIFGTQTAFLETFLLNLKIKGPVWLQIKNVKPCTTQLSWCKLEFIVENYKTIQVIKDLKQYELPSSPPLTALTFIIQTALNKQTQEHEIVLVCGLINQYFYLDKTSQQQQLANGKLYDSYFCALNKPSNVLYPYDFNTIIKDLQKKFKIEICTSERALLSYVLCKLHSTDADIIIGHDLFGFNFDILLNRCLAKKVSHWSRLGKLKRNYMPKHISTQRIQIVCSGRLLCDVMLSSRELLTKCKSFDLNELIRVVLKEEATTSSDGGHGGDGDSVQTNIYEYYATSQLLLKLIRINMLNAQYIYRICVDLQAVQLSYQITCIAGNVLSRTLIGGRSERNEFLLLHAFHDKDFILPDKQYNRFQNKVAAIKQVEQENGDDDQNDDAKKSKKSASYAGGLVLEPKVGFYDHFILLLDFNSLYPSIIQEYNICFTTIQRPKMADTIDLDDYLENSIKLPGQDEKPGILPLEIRKLVDSRKQVKQLLQKENLSVDLKMQYDIRQKALKLTANSMYGCLGFENSRFYCKPLAALITRFGRSILMKTKELVENKKIEVIYGDTDSIMINTNINDYEQVMKMGTLIKTDVNKLYRHLEIGIDGIYKCLLLLKKKKYAALSIESRNPVSGELKTSKEMKGLDIVRRDWCTLAKQIGEQILENILSGANYDLVLQNINGILTEYAEKINKNLIDVNLYEISKQLNRNPEDYNETNHQPHVSVALRFNRNNDNSKKYRSGDVVSYIICEDGSVNSATQRAYLRQELEADKVNLKIDIKYYLAQQIHPIVSRLCEPIEGIDSVHIATCLGLDPSGFRHKNASTTGTISINPTLNKQQQKLQSYLNERESYKNCTPFKFTCPMCKAETEWKDPFVKNEDESSFNCVLDSCTNESCEFKPINCLPYIKNNLSRQLATFIKQYYQFWLYCEDSMCAHRTKRISSKFMQYKPNCIECDRSTTGLEYTHSDLYYQMKYFKYIFDIDSYKNIYKNDLNQVNSLLQTNQNLVNALKDLKDYVGQRLKKNSYGLVNLKSIFTNDKQHEK